MTNQDLDDAFRRAKSEAKRVLARDAGAAFDHIDLLPVPQVAFRIWSRTAYKHGWLYATEDTIYPHGLSDGPPFTTGDRIPVWSPLVADPPAWKVDKTWPDLVRDSWYRVRPFTGKARLMGVLPVVHGQEQWGHWSIWFEIASHPLAGGTKEVIFGYKGGQLEQFEW